MIHVINEPHMRFKTDFMKRATSEAPGQTAAQQSSGPAAVVAGCSSKDNEFHSKTIKWTFQPIYNRLTQNFGPWLGPHLIAKC